MTKDDRKNMQRQSTGIVLAVVLLSTVLLSTAMAAGEPESICYGTPEQGRLEHGRRLPASGDNFAAYSYMGVTLGRTYVHSKVYAVIVAAYAELAKTRVQTQYIYGETGKAEGGPFKPHKTHQNGLSVDFMVPVLNSQGKSVPLPSSPLNKFGYDIEFSNDGRYDDLRIDYEAVAAHLLALNTAAKAEGIIIRRVIFDNTLQSQLFNGPLGKQVKQVLTFSQKKPWIRHDEHYHVDFTVACKES